MVQTALRRSRILHARPSLLVLAIAAELLGAPAGRAATPDSYPRLPASAAASLLWEANGTPVCTSPGAQIRIVSVPDAEGGVVIAWEDYRNSTPRIYAQRLNAAGEALWTADGVELTSGPAAQQYPAIVADGHGGAIVAWEDARDGAADVYAQHLNRAGARQWTSDGVSLCSVNGWELEPGLVSDGAGEVVAVWHDFRSGGSAGSLFAQKLTSAGARAWSDSGVRLHDDLALIFVVGVEPDNRLEPFVTTDGAGGAIALYYYVTETGFAYGIRRVDAAGAVLWPGNSPDSTEFAGGAVISPSIVSDGVGGAFVSYQYGGAIWIRHFDSEGVAGYNLEPVPLSNEDHGSRPTQVTSGAGTIHVAWQRTSPAEIFAQQVSIQQYPDGEALWPLGSRVNAGLGTYPRLASDGQGGFIAVWHQFADIYAARMNPDGTLAWGASVLVCNATGIQRNQTIVADGHGGAIVVWKDQRTGESDVYAQRLDANGVVGSTVAVEDLGPAPMAGLKLTPNPCRGGAQFTFRGSGRDVRFDILDVGGRVIRTIEVAGTESASAQWNGLDDMGSRVPAGLYWVRAREGGTAVVQKLVVLQ